jgi:hypothetical protein
MVGKQTGSRGSGRSQSDRRGQEDKPHHAGERVGVLTVARYVKDDGRALVLYARAPDEHE